MYRIIQSSPPHTGSTLLLNLIHGFLSPREEVHWGTKDLIHNCLITKTHDTNTNLWEQNYPQYQLLFIMSERYDHKIQNTILPQFKHKPNVLIIDYKELLVNENNTATIMIENIFKKLNHFIPNELKPRKSEEIIKYDMLNRFHIVNVTVKLIKNKSHFLEDEFTGIHGSHRGRSTQATHSTATKVINYVDFQSIGKSVHEHLIDKCFFKLDAKPVQIPVKQQEILQHICKQPHMLNIMEIGFGAGNYSELFLEANANVSVTSFDFNNTDFTQEAACFIHRKYPNRHNIMFSDSTTIAKFQGIFKIHFDLIFIHSTDNYEKVKEYILVCKKLAHENTVIIIETTSDSVVHSNRGAKCAWNGAIEWRVIKEQGSYEFSNGMGMRWGKYLL